MADKLLNLTVDCISRLKSIANSLESQEKFTVKVLDIYRYIVDIHLRTVDFEGTDVFDIVITDGRYKATCLLSNAFNHLVHGKKLQPNSIISVSQCSCVDDEESLDDRSYVVLRSIEILSCTSDICINRDDPSLKEIDFHTNATFREKQKLPLAAHRGYYLPLWNDEDCFGEIWLSNPDLTLKTRIEKSITILDLATFWKALKRPFPALIGRIVGKSRLNHYGKSIDKKTNYPYQAYLELEDRSATVSLCLWNSVCVKLYNYLQVGDIVAVLNYRVGRKFCQRSNAVYNTNDAVNIEISINPFNPAGEVYKLAADDVGPMLGVPNVPYRFIERGSMASFSAGLICDVVGVVTFVSQELREKKTNSLSFWLSKWIHLHDGTSPFPIILHVYACSQPDTFSTITPGMVLVCARMLLRIEPHDSRQQKFCFLTTTRESQLYLLKQPSDVANKPFSGCDSVRDLIKWRQSHQAKQLLRLSCTGGLYSFPPLPVSLESYKRLFPADNPIELTNTVHLGVVFEQLHFRQYLRLHIQGVVVAIEFVPFGGVTEAFQSSGVTGCSDSQQSVVSSDSVKKKATSSWGESQIDIRKATTSSSGESSDKHERVSGSSRQDIAEHQNVKRRVNYERRVNPPRSCKRAHRRSARELHSTSSCEGNSNRTQERHEIKVEATSGLTAQRVNPRRKCRKDVPKYSRRIKKTDRREEASSVKKEEILRKSPPKKSKNRSSNDSLLTSSGSDGTMDSTSGGSHHSNRLVVSKKNELQQVTETGSYFPFRILDRQWIKSAPNIPTWGMSHCHLDTFPRLCSRERSGDVVLPRADRQGFVDAEGYWRLLIMGLNRQAVISALFMPQYSDTDAPEDGTFLSALATGEIPRDVPLETLLDRASTEMKTRRTVFVLDVYCHEQDQVEVVINRAY